MKEGFIRRCRRFIGLDGSFLRDSHYRVLLAIVASYANDGRYPIGYIVVEGENKESYSWFISLMESDLQLQEGEGCPIISYERLGISVVIKDILPKIGHIFYA